MKIFIFFYTHRFMTICARTKNGLTLRLSFVCDYPDCHRTGCYLRDFVGIYETLNHKNSILPPSACLNFTIYTAFSCRCLQPPGNIFTTGVTLLLSTVHRPTVSGAADVLNRETGIHGKFFALMREYGISARLTFDNSQLEPVHLADPKMQCAVCPVLGK